MANALNKVNSGGIEDGSIVNADIKSDAAIAGSKLADNAVGLAQMASGTDGQIITYDASGDPIAVGPGTDGQVLTSTGAGSPPAFETLPTSGATLSGSTNNTIVTVTGSNAMQGEANLTFDGNNLNQTIDADNEGFKQTAAGNHYIGNIANADITSGAGYAVYIQTGQWDGTQIAQMRFICGDDTTNKDDGDIAFYTSAGGSSSEVLRLTQEKNVEIADGNLKVASGHGIDFSATGDGSGTMSSELLDDYEEGTFTGTWTAYTTACTTTDTSTNYYTKIGQQVTCYINASNMTLAGGGGAIKMEGLPYATSSDSHGGATGTSPLLYKVGFDTNYIYTFYTWQSVSFFIGYQSRNGTTWQAWDITEWDTAGSYCQMTFTYRAAT